MTAPGYVVYTRTADGTPAAHQFPTVNDAVLAAMGYLQGGLTVSYGKTLQLAIHRRRQDFARAQVPAEDADGFEAMVEAVAAGGGR